MSESAMTYNPMVPFQDEETITADRLNQFISLMNHVIIKSEKINFSVGQVVLDEISYPEPANIKWFLAGCYAQSENDRCNILLRNVKYLDEKVRFSYLPEKDMQNATVYLLFYPIPQVISANRMLNDSTT